MYLRVRPVEDAMRDAIRVELLNEFSGRGPKDIAGLVAEARAGLQVEPVAPLVQRDASRLADVKLCWRGLHSQSLQCSAL